MQKVVKHTKPHTNAAARSDPKDDAGCLCYWTAALVTMLIIYGWCHSIENRVNALKLAQENADDYEDNDFWNKTTIPGECKMETLQDELVKLLTRYYECGWKICKDNSKSYFDMFKWDFIFLAFFIFFGMMIPVFLLFLIIASIINALITRFLNRKASKMNLENIIIDNMMAEKLRNKKIAVKCIAQKPVITTIEKTKLIV